MDCWLRVCACVGGGWMRRDRHSLRARLNRPRNACAAGTAPAPTPPPAAETEKPAPPAETPAAPSTEKPADAAPADTSKPSASKYGPGIYAHFTTNQWQFHRQVLRQGRAEDRRQLRRAGRRQEGLDRSAIGPPGSPAVLPERPVSSHHSELHDSGWRSRGHRHGRPRIHVRRRDQPEPSSTTSPASSRWRIADRTPTAGSSSSPWRRIPRSTASTRSSAKSSKAWTTSWRYRKCRPAVRGRSAEQAAERRRHQQRSNRARLVIRTGDRRLGA